MGINTREDNYKDKNYRTFASMVSNSENTTHPRLDVIEGDARLYIEGVEVPFQEIHVSEPYGDFPVCSITIPPFAGLTEIGRNYFPKVHVFYKDTEMERFLLDNGQSYEQEDIYRLKFSGVIHRYSYSKMVSASATQQSMSFHCVHKYYVLHDILTKFNGRGVESLVEGASGGDSAKSSYYGSDQMILSSMQPIKYKSGEGRKGGVVGGISTDDMRGVVGQKANVGEVDHSIVPSYLTNYYDRLQGVPGYLVNIWNAVRSDSFQFSDYAKTMVDMYIPLVEEGIQFFQGVSGHPMIEEEVNNSTLSLDGTKAKEKMSEDETTAGISEVILPPLYRTSVGSAAAIDLGLVLMSRMLSHTGERAPLSQIFAKVLMAIKYDQVTLGSPVQAPLDSGLSAIHTLIKPIMPTYFSPTCNVMLPTMYSSLSIEESYYDVPTRVAAVQTFPTIGGVLGNAVQYRAPHLYRLAISNMQQKANTDKAIEGNLADTLSFMAETFGQHEAGRGIKHKQTQLEQWIMMLSEDLAANATQEKEETGTIEAKVYDNDTLSGLAKSWYDQNKPKGEGAPNAEASLKKLNPWNTFDDNGLQDYQRNMMTALDYDYALTIASTRVGRVNGVFNPYIIPGYPCDIMGKNFTDPSYHAFVTSVDTTFSGGGAMNTSMTFSSAYTYEELLHYALPGTQPWLAHKLGLTEQPYLASGKNIEGSEYDIESNPAHKAARDYYFSALGVGFANPDALYNFKTGKGKAPSLNTATGSFVVGQDWPEKINGELVVDPRELSRSALSTEGALAMVRREIQTMADVVSENLHTSFIHIPRTTAFSVRNNDPNLTPTEAVNAALANIDYSDIQEYYSKAKEVGKSVFLKYRDEYGDGEDTSKSLEELIDVAIKAGFQQAGSNNTDDISGIGDA